MAAIQGDWYASRSTHDGESYPQGDDTVRFVYSTQADGTKFIVAKVWSGDDGDYAGTAKLVAAAPDLLATCKALALDIRAMQFTDGEYRLSLDSARWILALLDRGIAKAEGEE